MAHRGALKTDFSSRSFSTMEILNCPYLLAGLSLSFYAQYRTEIRDSTETFAFIFHRSDVSKLCNMCFADRLFALFVIAWNTSI